MRIIALDIGDVRTGIAYATTKNPVAIPLDVIPTKDIINCSNKFKEILDDYMPDMFLVGLPKSMDGKQNSQAIHIKDIAKNLSLPVEYADERMSSLEAKSYLHQLGLSSKQMRGKVDKIAASIFLDTYLKNKVEVNRNTQAKDLIDGN